MIQIGKALNKAFTAAGQPFIGHLLRQTSGEVGLKRMDDEVRSIISFLMALLCVVVLMEIAEAEEDCTSDLATDNAHERYGTFFGLNI
ncbi:hypothetical protein B9Z55_014231 [Caenorhabditis nigoni]|uniref:Uncharacterized protein n=1 Tax=Caenorhabditis nigoni TaxID=1611254 RepID=A0A2G5U511_9PELO|nr:hypothetical protein B9Z55_014231 [Caenorhabditis nigoni]